MIEKEAVIDGVAYVRAPMVEGRLHDCTNCVANAGVYLQGRRPVPRTIEDDRLCRALFCMEPRVIFKFKEPFSAKRWKYDPILVSIPQGLDNDIFLGHSEDFENKLSKLNKSIKSSVLHLGSSWEDEKARRLALHADLHRDMMIRWQFAH